MDIRTSVLVGTALSLLHAHLIFVTKFGHKVFADRHPTRMEETARDLCADFDTEFVEFNGEANHVHLLVDFPAKVAVSKLVNSTEGVSSRWMRQELPDQRQRHTTQRREVVHRAAEPPVPC
jgi:putative transposase